MAEKRTKENTTRNAGAQPAPPADTQPTEGQQGALDAARPVEPESPQIVADMAEEKAGAGEVFEIAVLPLQQTTRLSWQLP